MARSRFSQMRITRGAMWLLCIEAAVSLLYLLQQPENRSAMLEWVAATDFGVWSEGRVWTLFTSPFLEMDLVSLLFDGFMLWMFVPQLERWWGTKRFLKFVAYTSVAGTLCGTAVGAMLPGHSAVVGLAPFIFSSMVAFGILYADQPIQFFGVLPMTGKQLMIGIIAFATLFVVLGQQWSRGGAYVGSMGLAWVLVNGKWTPRLWWLKRKQKKVRQRLKVMQGGKTGKRGKKDDPKHWLN